MDILDIIGRISPMPDTSMALLENIVTTVSFPKGHLLLQAGRVEPDVYFLGKGIARAYITDADARRITFWIGQEGATLVSLKSYVSGQPGYETIELMEPSVLYRLRRDDLHGLFLHDIHLANWGRKFAEQEFIHTEERLITLLRTKATDRYRDLITRNPELLQRLPLETLASYLGITPVTLSRIRAKIR
jgi:CRP-like cAMP-binding protein